MDREGRLQALDQSRQERISCSCLEITAVSSAPMTTVESIVVSLDMAKKLKEVGWEQEDYFAWYVRETLKPEQMKPGVEYWTETLHKTVASGWMRSLESYSAPSCEEILRRLPLDYSCG